MNKPYHLQSSDVSCAGHVEDNATKFLDELAIEMDKNASLQKENDWLAGKSQEYHHQMCLAQKATIKYKGQIIPLKHKLRRQLWQGCGLMGIVLLCGIFLGYVAHHLLTQASWIH